MKTAIAAASFCLLCACSLLPAYAQEEGGEATPSPQTSPAADIDQAVEKLTENQRRIEEKEDEIATLNKKIEELRGHRDSAAAEADLVNAQLTRLTKALAKAELELTQTQLTIEEVEDERERSESRIEEIEQKIGSSRQQLRSLFRMLYEKEQESFLSILLRSQSLSEVLAQRQAYEKIQEQTAALVAELQGELRQLEKEQAALEQQQADLSELSQLLEIQQAGIAEQRATQKQFLAAKRNEQVAFEGLLAEARAARQEIEQDLFTLKGTGVELTLTAANDMAKFAGKLTGVRPALLLAVLKVESNVGANVGNGKFPDDMHPASREAFVRITQKLKLDVGNAPISARPKNYQGWGGAMGPAQIMPETWERIEGRLSQLLGKPVPNPYELTDAFVATALLLADRGAANPAQEYEAVNRYLAGPNWQRFTWYGDRVLAVAKEYEAEGI